MSLLETATTLYLLLFSLYHIVTGIVSVFFSRFALKFYRALYGFHPLEKKQLLLVLKPWGNLALVVGIIGCIVLANRAAFSVLLVPFSLLLLIRAGYRFSLRRQLYRDLKVTPAQNWRMIIIQLLGAALFLWYAIRQA